MRIHPRNKDIAAIIEEINRENNSEVYTTRTTEISNSESYNNLCAICIENINNNNNNNICLPCGHIFHISCILKWALVQKNRDMDTSCPFCKNIYNISMIIKKIRFQYINNLFKLIDQLNFLIKKGNINLYTRYRIYKLKNIYKQFIIIIKNDESLTKLPILSPNFISLPLDLIKLVSETETKLRNKTLNTNISKKYQARVIFSMLTQLILRIK
jgi:hypothetical protein